MNPVCELLGWDTRFFGVRVARVVGYSLDEAAARRALDWCAAERVDCLYFLCDAGSEESVAAAERHGFGLKDVRLTYRRLEPALADAVPELPPGIQMRPARPDEAPVLEAIAEGSYTDSRFYFDRRFPRALADELYRVWVRQSVAGQADVVLVLEDRGRAVGFITCHLEGDGRTGRCGLSGLDPGLRGRGLGLRMYEAALRWFAARGVELVVYVTQARNIRAQRLFQRLGFLSHSTQLWYHKWFDRAAAPVGSGEAA
jgi:ribosomal protein S18 acetylase RimI-like enzyme